MAVENRAQRPRMRKGNRCLGQALSCKLASISVTQPSAALLCWPLFFLPFYSNHTHNQAASPGLVHWPLGLEVMQCLERRRGGPVAGRRRSHDSRWSVVPFILMFGMSSSLLDAPICITSRNKHALMSCFPSGLARHNGNRDASCPG